VSAKPITFRIGNVYTVEYDDHWHSERTYRDDVDDDCRLRSRGLCIKITPKSIILEHEMVPSDRHPINKRSNHHGIRKVAILKAQDFGPERI